MIRSRALRLTTRSRTTGKAAARHGSISMTSPEENFRMWSWQVAVPSCGPWAWPLIISPQEPQMPSRQSCSKATGSWPWAMSRSLRRSSISRNDMSSLTPGTSYSTIAPVEGVGAQQPGQLEEGVGPARLLQRLVERVVGAQHAQVAVELHPQGGDLGDGLLQALLAAGHAAVVPQDLAQLAVQVVDRAGAADRQVLLRAVGDLGLGGPEHRVVGRHRRLAQHPGQVVGHRVGQHEVAV